VFVWLRISPLRIKLAASNFAQWFVSVVDLKFWEGTLLPPKLPQKPKIRRISEHTGPRATWAWPVVHWSIRPVHWRGVGSACVDYTAVPEDGHTCFFLLQRRNIAVIQVRELSISSPVPDFTLTTVLQPTCWLVCLLRCVTVRCWLLGQALQHEVHWRPCQAPRLVKWSSLKACPSSATARWVTSSSWCSQWTHCTDGGHDDGLL